MSNMIEFSCPQCSANLRVPAEIVGKPAECPKCKTVSTVVDPIPTAAPVSVFDQVPGVQQTTPQPTTPVSPLVSPQPAAPQRYEVPAQPAAPAPIPPQNQTVIGSMPAAAPTQMPQSNPRDSYGADTPIRKLYRRITDEVSKLFVGQDELVLGSLVAIFSGGHVLIESVPGLGKTLFVRTLGKILGCEFGRIQFTADLMPSDITGAPIFNMKTQEFNFRPGPVFTQLLLADEINRAPAKAHAALLEIMQENNVTIDGETHILEPPFCVLATQNPIESEGTYNLPEAQLDRFMFKLMADYPTEQQEAEILSMHGRQENISDRLANEIETITSPAEILETIQQTASVRMDPALVDYINKMVRLTRAWPQFYMGASPRAGISLIQGARTLAAFYGRDYAVPDDVVQIAIPTLRHRVMLTAEAEVEGQSIDRILGDLIRTIQVPRIN